MTPAPSARAITSASLALAGLGASTAYVAQCAYELAVGGRGDPYLVVRDVHFGYYHRVALAAWLGGLVFVLARLALDAGRAQRVIDGLTPWVLPWIALLAIGTYVFP